MKKPAFALALAATSLLFIATTFAQTPVPAEPVGTPPPKMSGTDRAWLDLQAAAYNPDFSAPVPVEPVARKAALAERAKKFTRAAEQARKFHAQHPDHAKANEARLLEVRALVGATQAGDATADGDLTSLVQELRVDASIPASLRVQMVSAYAFPKAMRHVKDREGRLAEAAKVARGLAVEFPDQPQGAESLVNIAAASDEATARALVNEVLAMPASPKNKEGAQALLGRLNLAGKSLAAEFDGADLAAARTSVAAGRPTIIYTWASWSPGSFKLAADLRKLNPAANIMGLNLDEDTAAAEALAGKENLVGQMVYDKRGREGALAQRLKVRGAAQVILTDAQGIIREVRGENDLEKKIKSLGL